MKKICLFGFVMALTLIVLTLGSCEDGENGGGLFSGSRRDVTVNDVSGLRDGALVRLMGTIEYGAGEMYQFSDPVGGSIPVEIESEIWIRSGINFASLSLPLPVEIEGEVDKEGSVIYIDVTRIKVL